MPDMAWNSDQKKSPVPASGVGLYDPIVGRKEVRNAVSE